MAYHASGLSALLYANGFTLWHYRTADVAADVDNSGYFNAASKMLRIGDFIIVNAGSAEARSNGVMVVASNDNSVVDVTNLTAFGEFDAD